MAHIVALLAGLMLVLAAAVEAAHVPHVNSDVGRALMQRPAGGSMHLGRKVLQVGQLDAGRSGGSDCVIKVTGTGQKFGIEDAFVKCTTTDTMYGDGKVTLFAGQPLVDLYNADTSGSKFQGVKLQPPNEPDFLGPGNADPSFFFVDNGVVSLTGYVRNVYVDEWAVIHVEDRTNMTITNFEWSDNYGVRFPTLAVSRSNVKVTNSKWLRNICTDADRCHTGGAYVTEGARFEMDGCLFDGNKGHLTGALMITAGAIAKVTNNIFKNNAVVVDGAFGGAVFHDLCQDPRTKGERTLFRDNTFIENTSEGWGGAIRLGSVDGGCRATIVRNTFIGNKAKYGGGAIAITHCGGNKQFMLGNTFDSNTASMFNGQISYNPTVYPPGQPGAGSAAPEGVGCEKPKTSRSTFKGSAPAFSPPWVYP